MARGRKTGGRRRGTPNRLTQSVIERLGSIGCDPIEGMARIAMDAATPIEVRARMFAELAGYVAPKRKAIAYDLTEVDCAAMPTRIEIVGVDCRRDEATPPD